MQASEKYLYFAKTFQKRKKPTERNCLKRKIHARCLHLLSYTRRITNTRTTHWEDIFERFSILFSSIQLLLQNTRPRTRIHLPKKKNSHTKCNFLSVVFIDFTLLAAKKPLKQIEKALNSKLFINRRKKREELGACLIAPSLGK